jgi:hypothetical protein
MRLSPRTAYNPSRRTSLVDTTIGGPGNGVSKAAFESVCF